MRKLFISYTGMLMAIKKGAVTEVELNTALIFFGCSRRYALNFDFANDHEENPAVTILGENDMSEARKRHAWLVKKIEKAETEGRVHWWEPGQRRTWEDLSVFLAKHGYTFHSQEKSFMFGKRIITAIQQASLDLEVVWR